jgi:hypothetical protein
MATSKDLGWRLVERKVELKRMSDKFGTLEGKEESIYVCGPHTNRHTLFISKSIVASLLKFISFKMHN